MSAYHLLDVCKYFIIFIHIEKHIITYNYYIEKINKNNK